MEFYERINVYTSSPDPTLQFIGGGPTLGDLGATGIIIPADPTVSQLNRYLIRLCGIRVNPDCKAVIKGIRQYVTIAAEVPLNQEPDSKIFVYKKQITTPTWRFSDGSIAWFLTKSGPQQIGGENPLPSSLVQPPLGYSSDTYGITPGILYNQLPDPSVPQIYIPPFNGTPPGVIVNNQFGVWRDIRYMWQRFNTVDDLNYEIQGPGDLCLWASVYQTDPATRINPPTNGGVHSWLSPEDQFLSAYPGLARYFEIAGELMIDIYKVDKTPLDKFDEREIVKRRENKIDKALEAIIVGGSIKR